jgi:hypothetical protein
MSANTWSSSCNAKENWSTMCKGAECALEQKVECQAKRSHGQELRCHARSICLFVGQQNRSWLGEAIREAVSQPVPEPVGDAIREPTKVAMEMELTPAKRCRVMQIIFL